MVINENLYHDLAHYLMNNSIRMVDFIIDIENNEVCIGVFLEDYSTSIWEF